MSVTSLKSRQFVEAQKKIYRISASKFFQKIILLFNLKIYLHVQVVKITGSFFFLDPKKLLKTWDSAGSETMILTACRVARYPLRLN